MDWIDSSVSMTWLRFNELLAITRRTYFRFGFSLDDSFTHIFTKMECNANAIYYGGSNIAHCVSNVTKCRAYAKTRYRANIAFPKNEDNIWVFNTAGAYCDRDGQVYGLPPMLSRNFGLIGRALYTGHRETRQLTPEILKDIVSTGASWLARQIQPSGIYLWLFPLL